MKQPLDLGSLSAFVSLPAGGNVVLMAPIERRWHAGDDWQNPR
jgi:hypothetical protein